MAMKDILEHLAQGQDLESSMAREAFSALFNGELEASQAGAMLMGLRAKGETALEVATGVSEALKHSLKLTGLTGQTVDTCGTGGDGKNSFNCSTAVALYLADMGHTVVKHGNRAVSSSCGSADILEALGLPVGVGPEEVKKELEKHGFVFLFAPAYHPAFRHVMPIRQQLGIRTLFNLMGPLLNPARPTHQVLGVPNTQILELMAEALKLGGITRAAVVHGAGGYDELTPFGVNKVVMVGERIEPMDVDSRDFGMPVHAPEDVAVSGKDGAMTAMLGVLKGEAPEAMKDMLAINLGMALHLLDNEPLEDSVRRARAKADQGIAMEVDHVQDAG